MKQKVSIGAALIVTVVIFLTLLIVTKLFKIEDLPIQTIGVLFGGVITALITYFLLLGQTQAEENKERNVKVFEAKSTKFNFFIEKIWEIWEDRSVSLEELNEILKLVSKDIIMYSKPETVELILKNLNEIAVFAKPEKTSAKDDNITSKIQNNIFEIINILSKEIGLGGELNINVRNELNSLEKKIIPYLKLKNYKDNFFEILKEKIQNSEELSKYDFKYTNSYICIELIPNVELRYGSLERNDEDNTKEDFIYISNKLVQYNNLRHMTKSWGRERLKDSTNWNKKDFNFRNIELINQLADKNDFSIVDSIVIQFEKLIKNETLIKILNENE